MPEENGPCLGFRLYSDEPLTAVSSPGVLNLVLTLADSNTKDNIPKTRLRRPDYGGLVDVFAFSSCRPSRVCRIKDPF